MNAVEVMALLALAGWAVYKQTHTAQVTGRARFTTAVVYGAVGLAVGGFAMPSGPAAAGFLLVGVALSVIVGLIRGRLTTMWRDAEGRVWRKGNVTTVSLFIALVASKFVLATVAYVIHVHDGAGFGEVLVMIAIMIAVQADIIRRRAAALTFVVQPVATPNLIRDEQDQPGPTQRAGAKLRSSSLDGEAHVI